MAASISPRGQWGGSGSAWGSRTATAAVTPSLTPNANRLLVAVFSGIELSGAVNLNNVTISGGGLTWTQRQAVQSSYATGSYAVYYKVWTAPVGGSPSSMTVTITYPSIADQTGQLLALFEIDAYDAASPIGASISGTNLGSGAVNLTLPSAPAASSIVLAYCVNAPSSGALTATPASGWAEHYDTAVDGVTHLQVQSRGNSTSTAVQWDDVAVGSTVYGDDSIAGAIEIKASASVDAEAEPAADALALAGKTPAVSHTASAAPAQGALSIAGAAPVVSVSVSVSVAPGAGALALAGYAAAVAVSASASPGAGALAFTGVAPLISAGAGVSPGAGVLTLAGAAPTLSYSAVAAPVSGALEITGEAPTVHAGEGVVLFPATAELALASAAPAIAFGALVAPTAAALSLAGTAPAVVFSARAAPAVAALTLTGAAPSAIVDEDETIAPAPAVLMLQGAAPSVIVADANVTATPAPGAIALQGWTPASVVSPVGVADALQRAIVAALKADADVIAALGGSARIYDRPPNGPAFPYVTVGDDDIVDDSNTCGEAFEAYVTVHIWSRAVGRGEAKTIGDAVALALHAELALIGYVCTHYEFRSARYLIDPDGLTAHGVLTARYLIDPA